MIKQGVYEYHFKTSFQSRWLFSWIEDTRIKFTLWTHNNVQYVAVAYICKKNVRMRLGMHWILRIILSLVIPFWNNYRIFSHPVHCHWELNKKKWNLCSSVYSNIIHSNEFWPPITVLFDSHVVRKYSWFFLKHPPIFDCQNIILKSMLKSVICMMNGRGNKGSPDRCFKIYL